MAKTVSFGPISRIQIQDKVNIGIALPLTTGELQLCQQNLNNF